MTGNAFHDLNNFRVQSVEFGVTWPDDNVLTAIGEGPFPPGSYSPVVDDGFYVLLPPLYASLVTEGFVRTGACVSSSSARRTLST